MPIDDFNGKTFVAFMDIWAFRSLMTKKKAIKALNSLYNHSYNILSKFNNIEGIFVSDSGILFVRNGNELYGLSDLLTVIEEINRKMVIDGFILTTSIAFGEFRYNRRVEHLNIQKIPIYGHGYVSAWLDNEKGTPKIKPGQCRIFTKNIITEADGEREIHTFPKEIEAYLAQTHRQNNTLIKKHYIKHYMDDNKHYYFYWMLNNYSEIDTFEKKFRELCKIRHLKEKYEKILKILREAIK